MLVDVTICKDCVHYKPFRCEIWDRCVGSRDFCSNGRTKDVDADTWKYNQIKDALQKAKLDTAKED